MIIENIKIIGLYKYLNYNINLNQRVNIIHGVNGKGKTTILNIVNNILNGDFNKFYQLSFKEIIIQFEKNDFFKMYRGIEDEAKKVFFDYSIGKESFEKREAKNDQSVKAFIRRIELKPVLLPTHRLSIETDKDYSDKMYRNPYRNTEPNSFSTNTDMTAVNDISHQLTEQARRFSIYLNKNFHKEDNLLFERFFDAIFFSEKINNQTNQNETEDKIKNIKELKSSYSNKYQSFFKKSEILEKIDKNIDSLKKHNNDINTFLDLYTKNIKQKNSIIEEFFTPFKNFQTIINNLYSGKKVHINPESNLKDIFTIISDADDKLEIKQLSSGEKNLLVIFYHLLFRINNKSFFMIDEPELSLHIDWQYHIVKYFKEYSKNNQIFIVTHSPDILQNHSEFEINLDECIMNKIEVDTIIKNTESKLKKEKLNLESQIKIPEGLDSIEKHILSLLNNNLIEETLKKSIQSINSNNKKIKNIKSKRVKGKKR